MPGYADTKKLIEDTLVNRPAGTIIVPEDHQTFALSMLDYIHAVELLGASSLQGAASVDTVPVQPTGSRVSYISSVPPGQTYVYANFLDENGHAISVTSGANTLSLLTLLWNGTYWTVSVTSLTLAVGYTNGYLFKGIAVPTDNPGTPDQNVFYIASQMGTYTNFGGLVVADGEVAILRYNGSWAKEITGAATKEEVTRLSQDVTDLEDIADDIAVHNRNLADSASEIGGFISSGAYFTDPSSGEKSVKFPCLPSTTYTISKIVSSRFRVAYFSTDPVNGILGAGLVTKNSATAITITTASDSAYIVAFVYNGSSESVTFNQIMESLQIEIGGVATPYVAPGWDAKDNANYNNIPIKQQVKNPAPIELLKPIASNWTGDDGTVGTNIEIYDEVYQEMRDVVPLTSTSNGRFYRAFSSAVDFTTNVLRLSYCIEKGFNPVNMRNLVLELHSDNVIDSGHRAVFYLQQAGADADWNSQYVRSGWFHICIGPNSAIIGSNRGSSFDITRVTHIGFHIYIASGYPITVYAGEISVVRCLLKPGIINIVDNFNANVPYMADYAYSKGVKLNLSIVPNWIGTNTSAPLSEINRIKRQGHLIFNHTWNHIADTSSLTEAEIVEEITKANTWMLQNGFARGAKCISIPSAMFPFAKYKAYMESPAEIIYHHWTTYSEPSDGHSVLYYPYAPMQRLLNISSLDSGSSTAEQAQTSLAKMKIAIDDAETFGGIAVIGSHGTFWSADNGVAWKELIDYIASKTALISYGIDDLLEGNFV